MSSHVGNSEVPQRTSDDAGEGQQRGQHRRVLVHAQPVDALVKGALRSTHATRARQHALATRPSACHSFAAVAAAYALPSHCAPMNPSPPPAQALTPAARPPRPAPRASRRTDCAPARPCCSAAPGTPRNGDEAAAAGPTQLRSALPRAVSKPSPHLPGDHGVGRHVVERRRRRHRHERPAGKELPDHLPARPGRRRAALAGAAAAGSGGGHLPAAAAAASRGGGRRPAGRRQRLATGGGGGGAGPREAGEQPPQRCRRGGRRGRWSSPQLLRPRALARVCDGHHERGGEQRAGQRHAVQHAAPHAVRCCHCRCRVARRRRRVNNRRRRRQRAAQRLCHGRRRVAEGRVGRRGGGGGGGGRQGAADGAGGRAHCRGTDRGEGGEQVRGRVQRRGPADSAVGRCTR